MFYGIIRNLYDTEARDTELKFLHCILTLLTFLNLDREENYSHAKENSL